jgi:hypothetical protein
VLELFWKSFGTVIGFLCCATPGLGGTIAAMLSYVLEKKISKHPEEFGQGTVEGIATLEAATNAIPVAPSFTCWRLACRNRRHGRHHVRHPAGPDAVPPAVGPGVGTDRQLVHGQHHVAGAEPAAREQTIRQQLQSLAMQKAAAATIGPMIKNALIQQ